MWTPRRILLLLLGAAGFTAGYVLYARALGGVDGLPALPPEYLVPADDRAAPPPTDPASHTHTRLREAFGDKSPEVVNGEYNLKWEERTKGFVLAAGQPAFGADPARPELVTVAPFSVAFFGKPRPGEAQEVSTFHADLAVLEFDRPVAGPVDLMNDKAKLVGMKLVGVPDSPTLDPRKGRVWVTNNQKSADPAHQLVFRTPGPLFYRAADTAPPPPPDAPQVWTAAAVEVVDKKNLPRVARAPAPAAPTRADALRGRNAVADILAGVTLPPPTLTAEGMKIYLDAQDKAAPDKKSATGYTGVRLVELGEKVQMNLWTAGGAGLPGDGAAPKPAAAEPPAALAGLAGGALDGAVAARRLAAQSLLVVETLGPFRYDFKANRARFEAAPAANPAVSNFVTVTRASALGSQDHLACKVLVVDFFGPAQPAAPPPAPGSPPAPGKPAEGMRIKGLTATGDVYLAVEADQLQAHGTELVYAVDPAARRTDTTLRGAPVVVTRERSKLTGGRPGAPGEVVLATADPPPPAPGTKGPPPPKRTRTEVRGPGQLELAGDAGRDAPLLATWGRSLTHEKDPAGPPGEADRDLLKFEGGGTFEDPKGEMRLAADRLWLWLAPAAGPGRNPAAGRAVPHRLLAVDKVEADSPELVVTNTDQLTVWFKDIPTPKDALDEAAAKARPEPPPPPPPGAVGGGTAPPLPPPPPPPPPVKKKDPPVKLSARVVEGWVVRYPAPAPPPAKGPPPPGDPAVRYDLERARCEDRVVAEQDPVDPAKNPRGLVVGGDVLNLHRSRAGAVVDVAARAAAQVQFEGVTLIGPAIRLDQPNNAAAVDGVGRLIMPGAADAGGPADRPTVLDVQWATSMRFAGTRGTGAWAEFVGRVQAVQRPARPPAAVPAAPVSRPGQPAADPGDWTQKTLLCHQLDVTFDRPVQFNNLRRPAPPGADGKGPGRTGPKLQAALCLAMPDDEAGKLPPDRAEAAKWVFYLDETVGRDGKVVKAQKVDARQITVRADDLSQQIDAAGPGEVRILQPGAKDAPGPEVAGRPAGAGEQEMKLTWVRFPARMVADTRVLAEDRGKTFQKAAFPDGAQVLYVPADALMARFPFYAPPAGKGAVFLSCTTSLEVSSSKVDPAAPPDQRMTAVGAGEFRNDEYEGRAHTIRYDGDRVTFEGQNGRLAHLYRRRAGPNATDFKLARRIDYYPKTGLTNVDGAVNGGFSAGP